MGRLFRNWKWQWIAGVGVLGCLICPGGNAKAAAGSMASGPAPGVQEIQMQEKDPSRALSQKQKKDLLKTNFEKMKQEADELATLAKSLQDDLNKSSEHVLSIQIMDKADRIEKLAHKIKNTAKGY